MGVGKRGLQTMEMLYKPDWAETAARFEAWWAGEALDRCALAVTAPLAHPPADAPAPPSDDVDLETYWTDPEHVVARFEAAAARTFFGGEAFPLLVVNMGPGSLAGYLGSPVHLADDTIWFDSIIKQWDAFEPVLDPANEWWQITRRITAYAAERAAGRYFVSLADLGDAGDLIAHLRGSDQLCVDLIMDAQPVLELRERMEALWCQAYDELLELIHGAGLEGSSGWIGLWSPGRTYPLANDFSCMISARMFRETFRPELEHLSAWLDHSIYHLDGPGALHHLDAILELPHLNAVQWVPGAGAPPATHWIPVLRRIQRAGKGVQLDVAPGEVEFLLQHLSARGLFLRTSCATEAEARELLEKAKQWSTDRPRGG